MVNDQEPRYRLVDSNGNIVGSLFQNADGNVEIQDETGTGSVFGPDGIVTPAIDAGSASVEQLSSNIYFSSEFDTLQDAINQTQRDDVIFVTKLHNENVTIDERITLIGGGESVGNVGISSDSSDPTVKITENDVNIRSLGIENSGSGDALLFENSVQCCIMSSRIFRSRTVIDSDSQFVRIIGCNFAGEDIDVNGDENVVLGNVRVGTTTDSGAGNEVANNT